MANSTATLTLTVTAGTQNAADNKRDLALRDYALSQGLDIFQSDGTTIDNTKIAPAVRFYIATQLRDAVIQYRAGLTAASTRATEVSNLGTL